MESPSPPVYPKRRATWHNEAAAGAELPGCFLLLVIGLVWQYCISHSHNSSWMLRFPP